MHFYRSKKNNPLKLQYSAVSQFKCTLFGQKSQILNTAFYILTYILHNDIITELKTVTELRLLMCSFREAAVGGSCQDGNNRSHSRVYSLKNGYARLETVFPSAGVNRRIRFSPLKEKKRTDICCQPGWYRGKFIVPEENVPQGVFLCISSAERLYIINLNRLYIFGGYPNELRF